jgi:hypothetical protein
MSYTRSPSASAQSRTTSRSVSKATLASIAFSPRYPVDLPGPASHQQVNGTSVITPLLPDMEATEISLQHGIANQVKGRRVSLYDSS